MTLSIGDYERLPGRTVFEKKLENQASVKQAELGRKDNPGRIMRK